MGLDIGLNKAGLKVVVGQDFEPACVDTMRVNGHNVIGGDIRELHPQALLDQTGLHIGEPFFDLRRSSLSAFLHCRKAVGY